MLLFSTARVHLDGPSPARLTVPAYSDGEVSRLLQTLDALLPSQQSTIDSFFQSSLAQIGSGERVQRGVAYGEQVANAVLAARANDGAAATPPVFTPLPGPGEYLLTPPAFAPAGFTQTQHVTPFVLDSASQFRAPAPKLSRNFGAKLSRW